MEDTSKERAMSKVPAYSVAKAIELLQLYPADAVLIVYDHTMDVCREFVGFQWDDIHNEMIIHAQERGQSCPERSADDRKGAAR